MHHLSAHTRISRRQLKQSLPAVDQIPTNDLRVQIAVALDKAAIAGTGVGPQPTGILNIAGIGDVAMGRTAISSPGPSSWSWSAPWSRPTSIPCPWAFRPTSRSRATSCPRRVSRGPIP